jgi:hypothetical protein
VSVALVRNAKFRAPQKANTTSKPATIRGCMRLRSHSNDIGLRSGALKRCTKKRWASGTSHLAVVNSPCAQGLQAPFKAQPKAIARLARKIRCRLETSTPLIAQKRWSQTLAERLICEKQSPSGCSPKPRRVSKGMRLFVRVQDDEIVVTSDTGFRAAYCKRPNHPQLKVRRRTETDDQEVLAQAWQAANAKARELGWIV